MSVGLTEAVSIGQTWPLSRTPLLPPAVSQVQSPQRVDPADILGRALTHLWFLRPMKLYYHTG